MLEIVMAQEEEGAVDAPNGTSIQRLGKEGMARLAQSSSHIGQVQHGMSHRGDGTAIICSEQVT
jgi:hypothetical protein